MKPDRSAEIASTFLMVLVAGLYVATQLLGWLGNRCRR